MTSTGLEAAFLFSFLDELLGTKGFPDYDRAWNGVQVEGPDRIRVVAAAVDASEAAILEAAERGADLLLVHHGLFWDPDPRLVGPLRRKVAALLGGRIALYASHLPLDAHPEVGNGAVLARALELQVEGRFGEVRGVEVGWWGTAAGTREELRERVGALVGGDVRLIPGGREEAGKVAVVTGAGGSLVREAARWGMDTLLTGEGAHHSYAEAMERGVNLLYAGHYATETWGVRALAARLQDRFGLPWVFVDVPSGL
jgi:dinuclear metal center YbgI/SA1388 family protein